jgi:transcription elongation factor SPT5
VVAFNHSFIFRNYANEGEETESGAEGFQQALLPTFKDPKMWAVRCKPGFERFTVTCLMQKMLNLQNTAERLQIYSVIAPDHLKGYLYIEADRDTFVKEVTKALQLFEIISCQLFLAFTFGP